MPLNPPAFRNASAINQWALADFRNRILIKVSPAFDVIKTYLDYLRLLGFAGTSGFDYFAERPKSLDAPNQRAAVFLEEAIKSVDPFAPNVDELIHGFLMDRFSELIETPN